MSMKTRRLIFRVMVYSMLGLVMTGMLSACSSFSKGSESEKVDVVAKVIPLQVKHLSSQTPFDVMEKALLEKGWGGAVVLFEIEDVLKGEFDKVKVGGPSKMAQIREAAGNKNILALLTLDFDDPDEEVKKRWLTIAVEDPRETFGIENWEEPKRQSLMVYLSRLPEDRDSFILVRSEIPD
ncbi:MAG: hypothetical protein JW893_05645 [Candidatus Omnitrophica bacterium]|nr:hypothetical protein [Candidatus Omnitrophota bacterium]